MAIEVFAELACPFTHLALRRIVERRRDLGRTAPLLRVRPWPLELVNGKPNSATLIGEEVDALRDQVSPDLFEGFDVGAFPKTSLPGFRLVEAAYAVDDATGERVSLALRDALFEEGRDLADPDVLASVASSAGIEVPDDDLDAVVRASHAEGERRGVEGSPHFFVAGESAFCPLLDIQKDADGHFHLRLDEHAVNDLLARWFTSADR